MGSRSGSGMTMDRTWIWNQLKKETFDFDIDSSAVWKRYPWFSCDRYYLFTVSTLSKRSATVFCCCALLLHSTAALHFYALLLRSITALHHCALLSRSTLILYYYASLYRIRTTSQWSSKRQLKAIQRDRPNNCVKETLKLTSRASRYQLHQLLGDFKIFYVLWVDKFFRPRIKWRDID